MPHIVVEAPSRLAAGMPWSKLAGDIHAELAASGHAKLHELKTRLVDCATMVSGDNLGTEHLAVSLIMTNPRSLEAQQEMASVIARHLGHAVREAGHGAIEICVFCHYVPKTHYLKQAPFAAVGDA